MTIVSKTVSMSDRQLITNVTKEMLSDIKNLDFYVSKKLVYPINNKIITIKECSYSTHYEVHIDYVFFERLMKLTKITNIDTYKEIERLVEICEQNKRNWMDVVWKMICQKKYSQSIDKEILKKLLELGTPNGKKYSI